MQDLSQKDLSHFIIIDHHPGHPGWWFQTAVDAQSYQLLRPCLQILGRLVSQSFAMAVGGNPMNWGKVCDGGLLDLVCFTKVFDIEHEGHLMVDRATGQTFIYSGFLDDGFYAYTLFDVSLKQQFPCPVLCPTKHTTVLGHRRPTWDALTSTIDLCAGFGGLTQGSLAAGMDVVVSVDQNPKLLALHGKAHQSHRICGDFGMKDTLIQIWKQSHGAAIVTSGFSCQPYSKLGDGKGQEDSRSDCLTKTLNAAFFLNAQIVVLECVAPAAQDSFVRAEIERFTRLTGFHCSQIDLRLESIWPCRRHRAWWVLSAPNVGHIKLNPWCCIPNVTEVQQVIPAIQPWDEDDEHALELDEHEMSAFGVHAGTHARYLLNGKGHCPCALHAWGSQTRACSCGCRPCGFSQARLDSKGLHGCLTRSAPLKDGQTVLRHLHPNEVMGLNTMDPILDFGTNVRLTLSAAGQIACPAQALWSFISARIAEIRMQPKFDPNAQIQAYRAWLLMRCRQVWPCNSEVVMDPKLVTMIEFWHQFKDLSLAEVLYPLRWVDEFSGPVNVASVLDHIIRAHEKVPPTIITSDDGDELDATPWLDSPSISDDPSTEACMCAEFCTVVFEGSSDSPLRFQPRCDSTIAQFLVAHRKLVGDLAIESITMSGQAIPDTHIMHVGQVIVVKLAPVTLSTHVHEGSNAVAVSPTAEWSHPVDDQIEVHSPPRKVSKFDVGECSIPVHLPDPDDSWLDASPFLGLQGDQFLKLSLPSILNVKQLWSIRHQYFRTEDRMAIMNAQGALWADDEIRFHVAALVQAHQEYQAKHLTTLTQLCVIDPLLMTSWIQNKGFDCACWGRDHPEIAKHSMPIVTVALVDQHWIPLLMTPIKGVLQVQTWDHKQESHQGLESVLHRLAISLGFTSALIQHEHRMFFSSDLCGALAIVYLRGALCGAQLPSSTDEAAVIHTRLRETYCAELRRCQITRRPWIWGAGDHAASSSNVDPLACVNVSRDQRIDMINDKGTAFGDDEIRFHLIQLTTNQPRPRNAQRPSKFLYIEPLVFSCWHSIGRIITEQWCRAHPDIVSDGSSVITSFCVQDHWLPVWFSPLGDHVQIHTLKETDIDVEEFVEVLTCIANQMGFTSHAVHFIPPGLTDHKMCGAQATAFLGHVVMGMPLPTSVRDLRDLLTHMRASFVANLYSLESTPRPVVWGYGLEGESGLLPEMPVADPFAVQCCAFSQPDSSSHWSIVDSLCCCIRKTPCSPSYDETIELRRRRGDMIASHGVAIGDDEILFHLQHIMHCLQSRPDDGRRFVLVPPIALYQLALGDHAPLREWIDMLAREDMVNSQVVFIALQDLHWIRVWIAIPDARCHLLSDFSPDPTQFQTLLRSVCAEFGLHDFVTHSVPHGLPTDRLCGVTAVSFIAHIAVATPMPQDVDQLYERAWAMKQVFWTALQYRTPTNPVVWGWGFADGSDDTWECRPLPIMPAQGPFEASNVICRVNTQAHAILGDLYLDAIPLHALSGGFSFGLGDHVMQFHMHLLQAVTGPDFQCKVVVASKLASLY